MASPDTEFADGLCLCMPRYFGVSVAGDGVVAGLSSGVLGVGRPIVGGGHGLLIGDGRGRLGMLLSVGRRLYGVGVGHGGGLTSTQFAQSPFCFAVAE